MAAGLPLVGRPATAVLFRQPGRAITSAELLAEAIALATQLPPAGTLLNLCRDRYHFILALLAAQLRGQVCLLTGERGPAALATLAAAHPGCAVAVDDPSTEAPPGLPRLLVAPGRQPLGPAGATPSIPATQLAAIVFTSGSTGAPVAHAKRWGALVQRSQAAAAQFQLTEAAPASIVGSVPPQHMYGFETTALLPLHAPASSWCGADFFPADLRDALAGLPGPRWLVSTPLQLDALLRAGLALPPLAGIISATAPLEPALAQQAEAAWGAPMLEIFGATEVGSIASRRTLAGEAWSLYPDVALHVTEAGAVISAPHAPPVPLDDVVEPLPGNRFRLLGRRQDIVKVGGHRASLAGLNRVLLALPGVEDGTFLPPEAEPTHGAARLLAVVVAPGRSAAEIQEALRGRLEPAFLPRRVLLVPALPRNSFGKLSRPALLAMLAEAPVGVA